MSMYTESMQDKREDDVCPSYNPTSKLSMHDCNEHDTIYVISSDFGDRMTTQHLD